MPKAGTTSRARSLPLARIALVVGTLAGLAGAAVFLGGSDDGVPPPATQPTPTGIPTCPPLPPRTKTPAWYPDDLPLPKGNYAVRLKLGVSKDYDQATFAVKTTLQTFVQHVLSVWPKKGWTLGRGDAEPFEAEDSFFKRRENRFGAFRANGSPCDPNTILVYIVMGQLRAPGGNTPANPSPLVKPSP